MLPKILSSVAHHFAFSQNTLLQNLLVYIPDKLACYKVQYLLA
jgi:hypothetical protein